MSDIFLSLILGIIQGLTEFLPISSSAHLLIPSLLFGANDLGLEFDIAVHAGTLCAVIYFFKDELKIYIASIFNASSEYRNDRRVAINLLVATIPIVLAGIFFSDLISQRLVTKELIAWSNIFFASLLLLSFYLSKKNKDIFHLSIFMSLFIGCAQIFALIPGASRSGVVIMACLFLGLNLKDASRFAFLLAIPTILGALIFLIGDSITTNLNIFTPQLFVGFITSGFIAFFSIKYFLQFVERIGITPFFIYRVILGLLLIIL
tara:strand:+ start:489 stop:1277 length:789 start_codon:yes stop_codon:yes gene_type:complete